MSQETEDIDFWDLDGTILNAEKVWVDHVLPMLAARAGVPLARVTDAFDAGNVRGFTILGLLEDIGIAQDAKTALEMEILETIAGRLPDYIYPGVVELMRRRKARGIRQVLITAGVSAWQRWKFAQLTCLHNIFESQDRHFVSHSGSKGDVIGEYRRESKGLFTFVEDSTHWLTEPRVVHMPNMRRIRPQWPETKSVRAVLGDGYAWPVTRTIEELETALEAE